MSQYQKSADNMVLKELEKQKALEAELLKKSKELASQLRPQTSIDDLVHQAEEADDLKKQNESSANQTKAEETKTDEKVTKVSKAL